ncbi:hypothetical protein COV83_06055 [Candidatus Peregrinibacteria bacterium CG11_big_fil_rev_8_21_14_0_20_49_14]|nr:MAG: hypothetical protein COV83_06055 [Candidatus Peregrinibacteria bacterium CG11_big_fil_rev_8_21_14_0_20_49_14]
MRILLYTQFSVKFRNGNEKNPAFGQKKVRADIFSGSLAVFRNGRSVVPEGGGWRANISAAARKVRSYFFQRTPPIAKSTRFRQNAPANFGFKSDCFTFAPSQRGAKSGIFRMIFP